MSNRDETTSGQGELGGSRPPLPSVPPEPPAPPAGPPPAGAPAHIGSDRPRRRSFWRRLLSALGILAIIFSLMLNALMVVAIVVAWQAEPHLEKTVIQPGQADQVVAVFHATGVLDGKQARLADMFCREVGDDAKVRAVVIRVDSPGGGVSACDQMYRRFKGLRDSSGKTLVVSMGAVAASGGYYISAPAEIIFAEPTTVTGSIGVLANWPVLKGALDKLGIEWMVLRSTPTKAWKAAPNRMEKPADHHIAELQRIVDDMHARFEGVVRKERKGKLRPKDLPGRKYTDAAGVEFTVDEVEPFNGRVFLADRAVELGLVDEVGYLQDAIDQAGRLAGLTRPKVVVYSRRKMFFEKVGVGPPTAFSVGADIIERAQTPRLMMLWKVGQ